MQSIYKDIKGDKAIWMIVIILALASILAVYSATGSMAYKLQDGDTEYYLIQQIMFLFFGGMLTYVCYQLHYLQYSRFAQLFLFITIPLLIYTIGFGAEINDAKRWITIPWINKSFQTSDLAKLVLIIYVARSISNKQDVIKDWRSSFLPIIIPVIVVCGLILPSDLSTAALLFVTCVLMMFIGRVDLKYIGGLIGFGIVLLGIMIALGMMFPEFIRFETWVSRVNEFFYNTDGGYQIQQSKIAIASGEWLGVGPGNSVQRNYLPYPYADFIYAIICEEYGLIGGIIIIGLYLALLFRVTAIVTQCPKTFGAILAFGLGLNLVIQAFANIAVSVQLVPVTGLTLPLVSMGGTSVLFTCISLGIILSVSRYVEEARKKKIELNEMEIIDANNY
jgi:cell division protein FtsW